MRLKEAQPKERPILSFLLNPFGLGFPGLDSLWRGEGCPRAPGHPSADIQAVTNPRPSWRAPDIVGHFPAGRWGRRHCVCPGLGEMVKDGPGMETGVRPCPRVKEALGLGQRTSLPSPQPNHEKQPSPPSPQHQPGDHLGLEPSTATASWLSSLGQVSSQVSRLELVLEEPQGPARNRRAR